MPGHVGDALEALRAELRQIELRLEEFEVLRARRVRLLEAIMATEAVETDMVEHFVPSVSSAMPVLLPSNPAPPANSYVPSSPSDAALYVLREADGEQLHIRDIVGTMHRNGWFTDRTYESLRGTIAGTLDARAKTLDGVLKPEPATYAFKKVPAVPPAVEAVRQLTEMFKEYSRKHFVAHGGNETAPR